MSHHHVPRTVHCGSLCVTHQQSQQYPGAPGGSQPSVTIGGGTLPFTGGLDSIVLVMVALILVAAGSLARRVA